MTQKLLAVLLPLLVAVLAEEERHVSYQGHTVYVMRPEISRHGRVIRRLMETPGVDYWSRPSRRVPVTAMVSPQAAREFLRLVNKYHVPHDVTLQDVGTVLRSESEMQNRTENRRTNSKTYLKRYLRYDEMVDSLKRLAQKYPNSTELINIGKSFEGREMYMLRMSSDLEGQKPVVMFEAGIHAREWAAPALALHIIHKVLETPDLLEIADWHVIPSANPDGYEYTHTKDRLWRKTRSKSLQAGGCHGTDANRNFDVHWSEIGSSNDPCSETFHGQHAFSEIEAQNVANATKLYAGRVKAYFALHSFGNFILYPYGHTKTPLREWNDLDRCGRDGAYAIHAAGGPDFTVGNTATVLYPSGAGSDDYVKNAFNVPFSYTIELPGGGRDGFDPPPGSIRGMVQQVFPGMEAMVKCALAATKKTENK